MYLQKPGNKYNAKSSIYDGSYYHSKFEAAFAAELDIRLRAKDIAKWEKQIRVPLEVNGFKICTYIVDFRIIHNDGSIEWVECKGFVTDVARIKMRLFEAAYLNGKPNETYTIVKKGR
jgi:hypothetical protein